VLVSGFICVGSGRVGTGATNARKKFSRLAASCDLESCDWGSTWTTSALSHGWMREDRLLPKSHIDDARISAMLDLGRLRIEVQRLEVTEPERTLPFVSCGEMRNDLLIVMTSIACFNKALSETSADIKLKMPSSGLWYVRDDDEDDDDDDAADESGICACCFDSRLL